MKAQKLLTLLVTMILLIVVTVQCAVPAAPPQPVQAPAAEETVAPAEEAVPAEVQVLRVAGTFFSATNRGDMAPLDPARRGTWGFHSLLWAPLVWTDTAGNPDPAKSLAKSWETNEDATVYIFHLREDAKFSDGTPIDAEDVALDWGYFAMMMHGKARGYRENFGTGRRLYPDILGFMEFLDKVPYREFDTGKVGDIEGIKVIDEHTLEIDFKQPAGNFIKRLTGFAVFKPEDVWAGQTAEYDLLDYWPAHAASSGPYKIVEAVPGEKYVMEPNELYFGPKPQIDRIEVLAVSEDMNTILTAFANKELDMVALPLTGDLARQAQEDPYLRESLVQVPMWQVYQFWITPNPPLDDVHVRRAFSMAFDRQALVNILNAGSEIPLFEVTNMHRNPGVPHCVKETAQVTQLPFDPEAAKAELQKSPYWPDVLDMEINILVGNPFAGAPDLIQAEALQKMLQDNLGLTNVRVRTEEVPDMMNPPFPLHLWHNSQQPWYADITDTLQNMVFLMKDRPWKPEDPRPFVTVPYEPELKALVQQAMAEQDPAKRCELVRQAGQMWNDVAFSLDYGIPLAYYLEAPWVKGEHKWYENAGQGKPLNIEDWWIAEH